MSYLVAIIKELHLLIIRKIIFSWSNKFFTPVKLNMLKACLHWLEARVLEWQKKLLMSFPLNIYIYLILLISLMNLVYRFMLKCTQPHVNFIQSFFLRCLQSKLSPTFCFWIDSEYFTLVQKMLFPFQFVSTLDDSKYLIKVFHLSN